MLKLLKLVIGVALTATLVACGGGGDSTPAAPVTSNSTFDLKTAYVNYIAPRGTQGFTISGTVKGVTVTGTGTITNGDLTPATFEGKAALKKTSTATQSFTANGQTATAGAMTTYFFDSNYNVLGNTGISIDAGGAPIASTSSYGVTTFTSNPPQTVKVGDEGTLTTGAVYATANKTNLLSATTLSYVVKPDTTNTALISFIATSKDTAGNIISISTTVTRATTTGSLTFINQTAKIPTLKTDLTFTYI